MLKIKNYDKLAYNCI